MANTYDATMFQECFEHEFTWLNGFMRNVRRFGKRPALLDPVANKEWTYRELNADCNRLAHALQKDGVGYSDVVFNQLPNSPAFVFCYIAPQKLGAINSPGNFNLAAGETAKIIDHNKPMVYIYDSDFRDMAVKALELAEHQPKRVVMVDYAGTAGPAPEGHVLLSDYMAGQPETDPVMERVPHIYDEVTRLYTSGTTALPKGVPLNNVNEVLSAHDVMMHFPLNPMDKTMNTTPWFHRGGLHSGGLCPTLYCGAEVIIMRSFNPKTTLEYTEKYGITFLIGAPSVLTMLADTQEKKHYDLHTLHGIITMGAPMSKADCIRYMDVLTPNIFNGYGTTETFWNTFLRPFDLPDMAGSAGRSCTDDDVVVVRAYEDRRAEPDDLCAMDGVEVGEVIIKSPAKGCCSYYNNEEMTQKKYYKGWLYTGDLATWNEDTFITITGRKDDMIICSGENIYPVQIEEVLNEHPKISESMVTSVPDKARGQAVVAYIIPKDPSLTVREVIEHCNNSPMLSQYKRPRFYRFVDELPFTPTGKKKHFVMKEQAAADLAAGLLLRK